MGFNMTNLGPVLGGMAPGIVAGQQQQQQNAQARQAALLLQQYYQQQQQQQAAGPQLGSLSMQGAPGSASHGADPVGGSLPNASGAGGGSQGGSGGGGSQGGSGAQGGNYNPGQAPPSFDQQAAKFWAMPGDPVMKAKVWPQIQEALIASETAYYKNKMEHLAEIRAATGDKRADTAAEQAQNNFELGQRREDTRDLAEQERAKYDREKTARDDKKQTLNELKQQQKEDHDERMADIRENKNLSDAQRADAILAEKKEYHAARDKISQQNADIDQEKADTGARLAGNKVRHDLVTEGQGDKKQAATEKLNEAKIKKMESSVSAENKKPFMAARDTYNKAASLYQSLTRPGATPEASKDDIAFAKQKMDAAQETMTQLAGSSAGSAPAAKVKITPGEEVRKDEQGNLFVNRNGQAVPAEE